MVKCKECGNEFQPKTKKGVFCSLACRQKDYRRNKNKEFEAFKAAAANIKEKQIFTTTNSASAQITPKKSLIVRGVQWYLDQIGECMFEDDFKAMHEMILADEKLTKREKDNLLSTFVKR